MIRKIWAFLDNKPVTICVEFTARASLVPGDKVFCDNKIFTATPEYINSGGDCWQFHGHVINHQKLKGSCN